MRRLRSENELQDALDKDMNWRVQELDSIKQMIQSSESIRQKSILRAAIALSYAHWEGFVKNASSSYLAFVDCQKHMYEELVPGFLACGIKKRIGQISFERPHSLIPIAHFFVSESSSQATVFTEDMISTRSNLNWKTFSEIAEIINIDASKYSMRNKWIDEVLLKRRNQVAHGEHIEVDTRDILNQIDDLIAMLRLIKEDIEEAASKKTYLLSSKAETSMTAAQS